MVMFLHIEFLPSCTEDSDLKKQHLLIQQTKLINTEDLFRNIVFR